MADLPGGTVTLLFTDIEGSTRLLKRLGGLYPGVLEEHRRIVRAAVTEHAGMEVGTEGDAFFVAFVRASDALAAAVDAQRDLANHPWPAGASVAVRMGVHTGEPELSDGNYVGYDVHRAARICSSAHGGQIVVSEATLKLVLGTREDVAFVDQGEHWLKDLDRPEHLYQVSVVGLRTDFPPLRSLAPMRTNLPRPPTTFVGRDSELARLRDLVRAHRLVTLTGPGGVGKTRLALQAASDLAGEFPDGVWLVSLGAVTDSALVAGAMAATIGLRDTTGRRPVEVIAEYAEGRRMLLVLDNFEHVMDAAADVSEVVDLAAGVNILVTSREVLHLRAEHEMALSPMPLPEYLRGATAGDYHRYESVRLFVERAREKAPNFKLTDDNAEAVAEICRRLDGLPLAIELAAARIKVLSPQALVARLGDALALLTGGSRDLPDRQRALRTTIEWSVDLLDEAEQRLLARLSVFHGPVDLETVEAVCGAGLDVMTTLPSLVDKSLVQRGQRTDSEVVFWLLEMVRQFALEELDKSGTETDLRLRHTEHYQHLAEQAAGGFFGSDQVAWLDRVEFEQDNIQGCIRWLLQQGSVEQAAVMTEGVYPYWLIRGHYGAGRYWTQQLLGTQLPDPELRARLLVANARLASGQGAHDEARANLLEVLEASTRHRDEQVTARALMDLTLIRIRSGEEGAEDQAEQALSTFRRINDVASEAELLLRLGAAPVARGDYAAAYGTYGRALTLMRSIGNAWGAASALNNLGYVIALQGRFSEALPYLQESRALAEAVGSKEVLATCSDSLAMVMAGVGRLDEAAALYQQSLEFYRDIGYRQGAAFEQVHLARLRVTRSDYDGAAACLRQALQAAGDDPTESEVQVFAIEGIADLLVRTGRAETGAELLAAAERLRAQAHVALAPIDRERLVQLRQELAEKLPPQSLSAADLRGKAMTPRDALAAAMRAVSAAP